MFFAGDEFGNTSFGNNNCYCQDNIYSWLDWKLLDKNKDIFEFFKFMIAFRKDNSVVRKNTEICSLGFPPVSTHGYKAFENTFTNETKYIGVMYAGKTVEEPKKDKIVYMGVNPYWQPIDIELPNVSPKYKWQVIVNTMETKAIVEKKKIFVTGNRFKMPERTVCVFKAV